jgi:hypothetical protein
VHERFRDRVAVRGSWSTCASIQPRPLGGGVASGAAAATSGRRSLWRDPPPGCLSWGFWPGTDARARRPPLSLSGEQVSPMFFLEQEEDELRRLDEEACSGQVVGAVVGAPSQQVDDPVQKLLVEAGVRSREAQQASPAGKQWSAADDSMLLLMQRVSDEQPGMPRSGVARRSALIQSFVRSSITDSVTSLSTSTGSLQLSEPEPVPESESSETCEASVAASMQSISLVDMDPLCVQAARASRARPSSAATLRGPQRHPRYTSRLRRPVSAPPVRGINSSGQRRHPAHGMHRSPARVDTGTSEMLRGAPVAAPSTAWIARPLVPAKSRMHGYLGSAPRQRQRCRAKRSLSFPKKHCQLRHRRLPLHPTPLAWGLDEGAPHPDPPTGGGFPSGQEQAPIRQVASLP